MTKLMDFKLHLLTWNVMARPPVEDLSSILGLQDPIDVANLPDVYALGLQEVSSRPQDMMFDLIFDDPWVQGFKEILSEFDYVKMKQIRLVGIELFVFAKRKHIRYLRNIQTSYTRAGLKGMWGNKGGVSIRMNAYGCSLCFVNSHLAAHDGEIQQRIDDYNLIVDKQRFIDPLTENIITHDYVFWFGDLNFRIDDFNAEEILHLIRNERLGELLNKDQLRKVMKLGQAFSEFIETPPVFPPTFKFNIGEAGYDVRKRKPAWTDRILFRSTPNAYENITLNLKQLHYNSHDEFLQSDHKPVTASFIIKVFAEPEQVKVTFLPIRQWKTNEDCVAWYTYTGGDPQTYDWIALYKSGFLSIEEHVCYVWVPGHPSSQGPPAMQTTCNGIADTSEIQQQQQQPQLNSVAGSSSSLRQSRGPWYRVVFSDQTIIIPGCYQLIYFSATFSNILGISEPFEVIAQD